MRWLLAALFSAGVAWAQLTIPLDTNTGNADANTLRVVIATSQPQLTNSLLVTAAGALSINGAAATANRAATLPAVARSNYPSAYTAGRDSSETTDLQGDVFVSIMPNTSFATYAASVQGLAAASSATDVAVLPGNASNTVILTGVFLSCTQTTAGIQTVQLVKRSTADTSGTHSNMTVVAMDSNDASAVSVPLSYTANPTLGTTVGNVDTELIGMMATSTSSPNDIYVWKPLMGQSVFLRGTAQQIAVNLNGATISGASCDVTFDWIESTGL